MCEKSSARDRIREKTDSNIKVCRFVAQQDLANQTLWWRSHRIQKGTCTWKNICYETIRHLRLEMSSIIQLAHILHVHNLVSMWLAKKKLKCSCFEFRVLTNHIVWSKIAKSLRNADGCFGNLTNHILYRETRNMNRWTHHLVTHFRKMTVTMPQCITVTMKTNNVNQNGVWRY